MNRKRSSEPMIEEQIVSRTGNHLEENEQKTKRATVIEDNSNVAEMSEAEQIQNMSHYQEQTEYMSNQNAYPPTEQNEDPYVMQQQYNQYEHNNQMQYENQEQVDYGSTDPHANYQYQIPEAQQNDSAPTNANEEFPQ